MHVLLLAYHFPPDPAVGGLRAAKVAEAFRRAGHRVSVVAAAHPSAADGDQVEPGMKVVRVAPLPNPREWYGAVRRRLARRGASAGGNGRASEPAGVAGATVPDRVAAWKRWIFSLLWLPDDRQGWIVPAVRAAREIHRREAVDLVYSTAPPFSVHLAGRLAKRSLGARWAMEFRDPWTDNPWKPHHVRSRASDAGERWLERRCLAAADEVVTVSHATGETLSRRLRPLGGGRALVVRNGIDHIVPPRPFRPADRPVRLLYLGNLYHRRDPRPLFRALAALVARGALDPARVVVDFYGQCRWYRGEPVEGMIREAGLEGVVRLHDPVPHAECARLLDGADVLLLLAQEQPDQVPNKVYEYLGMRTPVLAFADADGETARMLRRVGGHHLVAGDDPAEAEAAVAAALGGAPGAPPDEAVLREWSTERQMARLVESLGG